MQHPRYSPVITFTTMEEDERTVTVPVQRWYSSTQRDEEVAEIGAYCTHCGGQTGGDEGRIPSERQDEGTGDVVIDGWLCAACQQIECAMCDKKTTQHETHPSGRVLGFVCEICVTLCVGEGPVL